MNIEPNSESMKEKMMAYLYNELSATEKASFEKELEKDPALKEEYESFKMTRAFLSTAEKKKVTPPPFMRMMQEPAKIDKNSPFKWMGSIAASLLILLFAAKLTGLSVQIEDGRTSIAFNSKNLQPTDGYVAKTEVDNMIQTSLAAYDQRLSGQLESRDNQQSDLINSQFAENRELLEGSIESIKNNNNQMMANYLESSNKQQKQYISNLMGEFKNVSEQRRNEDMQYLLAKINLLETDTELLEIETSQIKTSYAMNTNETAY